MDPQCHAGGISYGDPRFVRGILSHDMRARVLMNGAGHSAEPSEFEEDLADDEDCEHGE